MAEETKERIESELEVKAYIQNLRFALDNGAKITFQAKRLVDEERKEEYTNQYTVNTLFPDENPEEALKREIRTLTVEEYMRTVKDLRFSKKSEMREFGRVYNSSENVYIKIRVEVMKSGSFGVDHIVFIMSFHYSTIPFDRLTFPYQS